MTILINNLMFWIAVVFCVVSCYKMYLSKKMDGFAPGELVISEKAYRILLVLAVAVAVLIRVYKFGQVPGGVQSGRSHGGSRCEGACRIRDRSAWHAVSGAFDGLGLQSDERSALLFDDSMH